MASSRPRRLISRLLEPAGSQRHWLHEAPAYCDARGQNGLREGMFRLSSRLLGEHPYLDMAQKLRWRHTQDTAEFEECTNAWAVLPTFQQTDEVPLDRSVQREGLLREATCAAQFAEYLSECDL